MSLTGIVAILSIEVTRNLVARGYGLGYDTDAAAVATAGSGVGYRYTATPSPTTGLPYPPLPIIGCTGNGVSPIVVTTQYPHGVSARGIGGMSCVITGVTGNDAANNIDADPRSRTNGLPAGTLAVPTGPTTLALYGQDPTYGNLVGLTGSGTYTGGGVITPAFTDGSILIGRENTREQSAPPRIVVVPRGADWEGRDIGIPTVARNTDRQRNIRLRSIGNEIMTLDVHCWGQAWPPDPARDFDVCRDMAQAVVQSSYLLFGATQGKMRGTWDDEKERAVQLIKAGHLFTFGLTIDVPVVDWILAPGGDLPFVPPATDVNVTVQSPTPEIAQTFDQTITPS